MPPTIATLPFRPCVTPVTVSVWPGSGSLSFDRTEIVLAPLSSRTVVPSLPATGTQLTVIEAVAMSTAGTGTVAPVLLRSSYVKLAAPQKFAAGVNVKAPDAARFTVPPTGVPESTAVRVFGP